MCSHDNLGLDWLPVFDETEPFKVDKTHDHVKHECFSGTGLHSYCRDCGLVRSKASTKPKKLGYFMNVIGILRKKGVLEVQLKCICRAMKKEPQLFEDTFGTYLYFQVRRFVEIVKRYTSLDEGEIICVMESCN